jgi:hypothetical protein
MGYIGNFFSNLHDVDVMRLDISMSYKSLDGIGCAYAEWIPISRDDPNLRPFLICLLYARVLSIDDRESRVHLFGFINEISKSNIRTEGKTGFAFPEWSLNIGHGAPLQNIWPWSFCEKTDFPYKPRVYQATLKASSKGYFSIHLKMAIGLEKLLVPSSALIAIYSYCESVDQKGCYELALWLWQINEYYKSPNNISIGSESSALKAATNAIRSGNLTIP